MATKIIDNFTGSLTRQNTGELNSGLAKYDTSFGYDPFSNPTNLTWFEKPSIIGVPSVQGGSPLFNFAYVAGQVKSSITAVNVYAYGGDGRLTKIQVNSTSTPNFDIPSVLTANSIAGGALYAPSMQFYGNPEKIYIGTDSNIARVNFDGSGINSSVATIASSVISDIPRPSVQFLGKMYFANGTNLIEIDSTETVSSYAKLSPGFPSGSYIRDLDITPDGNYMIITVSYVNDTDLVSGALPILSTGSTNSYKFLWNGIDNSYTAYTVFSGFSLTANQSFGEFNYAFGYDVNGMAIYSNNKKIRTLPNVQSPNFAAVFSIGNMLGFMSPEYISTTNQIQNSFFMYGQYDEETALGLFRPLRLAPAVSVTSGIPQVRKIPLALPVTNLRYTDSRSGGENARIIGEGKLYFSPEEENSTDSVGWLYKFTLVPRGLNSVLGGVWESQNEIFQKKVKPTQLRFYTERLTTIDQSFKIDFVDATSSVLGGNTFITGTPPVAIGDDRIWWDPKLAPGTSWGVRVTNLGSKNWVGVKMEIDFAEAGK